MPSPHTSYRWRERESIKCMRSPHTSYRWRERVIETIKCMRSPHTSYRWRERESQRVTSSSSNLVFPGGLPSRYWPAQPCLASVGNRSWAAGWYGDVVTISADREDFKTSGSLKKSHDLACCGNTGILKSEMITHQFVSIWFLKESLIRVTCALFTLQVVCLLYLASREDNSIWRRRLAIILR